MKIKLEQDGNGEWNWLLGRAGWNGTGTITLYRQTDATKYPSRASALDAAREYVGLFMRAEKSKQIVKTEELEL